MSGLSALSLVYIALCYGAAAVFITGLVVKFYGYAATPAPLKIPTTPAPTTVPGVIARLAGEALFFTSLFKGNKWTWAGGYLFHATLALALLRHLRYFLVPVPDIVAMAGPPGVWAGALMTLAVVYLYMRRMTVDRTRSISLFADYFALALIGLIGLTGLIMKFAIRTDVTAVKGFIMGIVTFHPVNIPPDILFLVHLPWRWF